jgi:hypothetical protein
MIFEGDTSSSPGSRDARSSTCRRISAARARNCSGGAPYTKFRKIAAIAGACSSSVPFPISGWFCVCLLAWARRVLAFRAGSALQLRQ